MRPDGATLRDNFGGDAVEVSAQAPAAGTYTVLVSHSSASGFAQTGTASYTLTVSGTFVQLPNCTDINGDGAPDLAWRNTGSGTNVVWYLHGTTVVTQDSLQSAPDAAWQLVATADLNADGHPARSGATRRRARTWFGL